MHTKNDNEADAMVKLPEKNRLCVLFYSTIHELCKKSDQNLPPIIIRFNVFKKNPTYVQVN